MPAWTADCYDFKNDGIINTEAGILGICDIPLDLDNAIPCWSVGRLIEIYVIVRGLDISYLPIERGEDMVKYLIRLYEEKAKDMDFSKLEE